MGSSQEIPTDNQIAPDGFHSENTSGVERDVISGLFELLKCVKSPEEYLSVDGSPNADFEAVICCLWELSANEDYAHIFLENDCKSVLVSSIRNIPSQRVLEFCLGILSNLSLDDKIREDIFTEELKTILDTLIACEYPHVLSQVFRLLHCVLSHGNSRQKWGCLLTCDFFNQLLFILSSSTCEDLIIITLHTFDVILYNRLPHSDIIGHQDDIICALLSSFYQIGSDDSKVFGLILDIYDSLTEFYFTESVSYEFIRHFFNFVEFIFLHKCDCDFRMTEQLYNGPNGNLLRLVGFLNELTNKNRDKCFLVAKNGEGFLTILSNALSRVRKLECEYIPPEFENTLELVVDSFK